MATRKSFCGTAVVQQQQQGQDHGGGDGQGRAFHGDAWVIGVSASWYGGTEIHFADCLADAPASGKRMFSQLSKGRPRVRTDMTSPVPLSPPPSATSGDAEVQQLISTGDAFNQERLIDILTLPSQSPKVLFNEVAARPVLDAHLVLSNLYLFSCRCLTKKNSS